MKGNSPLFGNIRYLNPKAGDVSYMGTGDRSTFAKYVSKRKDKDVGGRLDVIAHGKSSSIEIDNHGDVCKINAREAARLIRKNQNFKKCKIIRLLSCNTGSDPNGFAQHLANALGKPVEAPNNYVWANRDGTYFVAGRTKSLKPDYQDFGEFITFVPGGNKNGK